MSERDTEPQAEVRLTEAEQNAIIKELFAEDDSCVHNLMGAFDLIERIIAARIVQARAGKGALRERIEAAARVRAYLDAVLLASERDGHYDVGHDDDVPLWSDDLAALAATPGDPEGGGDRG